MKTEIYCVQEKVGENWIDYQFEDCGQWTLRGENIEFSVGKNYELFEEKSRRRLENITKLKGDSCRIVKRTVDIVEEVVETFSF